METNNAVIPSNEEVQDITLSDETIQEIDEVLSKYFKTKEEIKQEQEQEVKKQKELEQLQQKELEKENKEIEKEKTTQQEFQSELMTEVQTLNANTLNINGLTYIAVVLSILFVIYVLFYKFLKSFI